MENGFSHSSYQSPRSDGGGYEVQDDMTFVSASGQSHYTYDNSPASFSASGQSNYALGVNPTSFIEERDVSPSRRSAHLHADLQHFESTLSKISDSIQVVEQMCGHQLNSSNVSKNANDTNQHDEIELQQQELSDARLQIANLLNIIHSRDDTITQLQERVQNLEVSLSIA